MSEKLVCAVDVGTASARAGIFDRGGRLLSRAERPILLNRPSPARGEHDSEDIWSAVCAAVRNATSAAGVDGGQVAAICFDATCSLVLRGRDGSRIGAPAGCDPRWDTISWFDHRALAEAEECTATGHEILQYAGGVMSPEMQVPKLMWLKRHRPEAWAQTRHVFDLADFLTWRATGSEARSQCTLACKWTYLPHSRGWSPDFFSAVGLDDLADRLPARAAPVGSAVGTLTAASAADLGLAAQCVAAAGLVDAYAGMLGAIGAHGDGSGERHLALVGGTSSCVMWFSAEPQFLPSAWGPYFGAALPDLWASEAGQSATGALLDHILRLYRQGSEPQAGDHAAIVARVRELRARNPDLGRDIHMLPDFHGNRSPFADPRARGVIHGLGLDASFDGLCALYWRACVAVALGVRHILEHVGASGGVCLHVVGGHARNPLLMELYADVTGVPVMEGDAEDAVLLGAAMAAATAAGWYAHLAESCGAMRQQTTARRPDPGRQQAYDHDFEVFLTLQRQQRELRALNRF